jgi:two-component system invasion response regulator UvrY
MGLPKRTSIALVDDHALFRSGVANLIAGFEGYHIIHQSANGREFIENLRIEVPDIAVLDVQMPVMNGEETALWLRQHFPSIKVLALTMHDDESHILRMIKAGARGYVLKDAEPADLKLAFDQLVDRGVYHSDLVTTVVMKSVAGISGNPALANELSIKEMEFLNQICTEFTYKEIATRMKISERAVDSYREQLFARFQVKSRVGLVLFALKNNLVRI